MSTPRKPSSKRTAIALGMVIFLAFASVLGVSWFQKARAVSDDTYKYLELFNQVVNIVQRDYVKELSLKDLIYGAIEGMLETLDPHTVFISKESYKQMREDISGEFGGLGIHIGIKEKKLIIIAPIEDTPAWRVGLEADDWITHIEKESTLKININEAVTKMRGRPGEPITISVMRDGFEEPRDFTIIREIIKIPSVKGAKLMAGGIGYVRLITFNENSSREMKKALKKIKEEAKGKLKGLILDLRGNPGGPLDQAIRVSDMFLSEGVIVSIKGRNETPPPEYAHKAGTFDDVPMVVLVNQHSASASEIVAGALQDHGRAVILGKTSFGKGSVQQLRTLKDSSGLKITTAYYYTPSERTIQEQGITPDIEVDNLSPKQKLKLKEVEEEQRKYMREKDLEHHFKHEEVTGEAEGDTAGDEAEEKKESAKDLLPKKVGKDTEDYQLQRALDLLRSFEIFQAVLKRK